MEIKKLSHGPGANRVSIWAWGGYGASHKGFMAQVKEQVKGNGVYIVTDWLEIDSVEVAG